MLVFFLTVHLIGSKKDLDYRHRRTVSNVEQETNTEIAVNLDRAFNRGNSPTAPITITVNANSRLSALRDLNDARLGIQGLLLNYVDFIDWGAKGRLIYEVASSCSGPHRPLDSTSRAVKARDPFGATYHFMSLVELPFVQARPGGKKSFHAAFLLNPPVLSSLRELGCYIKVCADGYKIRIGSNPDTPIQVRHCEAYMLVLGDSWQTIDRAVEIVNGWITAHVGRCDCAL
jgi:hypothetical protein